MTTGIEYEMASFGGRNKFVGQTQPSSWDSLTCHSRIRGAERFINPDLYFEIKFSLGMGLGVSKTESSRSETGCIAYQIALKYLFEQKI
jgi:hypothetical protein